MIETAITRAFGLKTPIISAGMAFIAGPELAAAVANAGGLGMLGSGFVQPGGLRHAVRRTRSLTDRPFGVDFLGELEDESALDVMIEEKVPLAVFFWNPPSREIVARLKAGGVRFWMQVGSVAEAKEAEALGAEALIVQGAQAGGHNRSEAPLEQLFPALRVALPATPLIAAGGIIDGRTMRAALAMGAEAVWCGTRFLASAEADAHAGYKQRVVNAKPGETEITRVFGPEWPGEPLRALVNKAVIKARGREAEALAESEGDIIGQMMLDGEIVPVPRYSAVLPTASFDADLEWACLTAGECAGGIKSVLPAGEIVLRMTADAA